MKAATEKLSRNNIYWNILKISALIVFVGVVPLSYIYDDVPFLLWTLIIPIVPIFMVLLGYNAWREICPLSFFTKLGQKIPFKNRPKIGNWFEAHYFRFQFWFLLTAFVIRILFINSHGDLLNLFFITVIIVSFLIGLIFRGKSWCNFLCPFALVEKAYLNPSNIRYQQNSACSPCTACKKHCPDIDIENHYWKEHESKDKKFALYAFPGLVSGYYIYHYLYSGSWSHYNTGEWARDPHLLSKLSEPGFYFLTFVPKWFAVIFSLLLFSYISYYLFQFIENWYTALKKNNSDENNDSRNYISHVLMVLGAFIAFNVYYIFAGVPSFKEVPEIHALFKFLVVVTSSILLWKGINRLEEEYIKDKFSRNIIKKWKWEDNPPKDLREIYSVYNERMKDYEKNLASYRESLSDLIKEGVLTLDKIQFLNQMKDLFRIDDKDHDKILNELKIEDKRYFNTDYLHSVEKNLQLENYKLKIESIIINGDTDKSRIEVIKDECGVSQEDHDFIMKELTDQKGIFWNYVHEYLERANLLYTWFENVPEKGNAAFCYLHFILKFKIITELKSSVYSLSFILDKRVINHINYYLENIDSLNLSYVEKEIQQIEDKKFADNFYNILIRLNAGNALQTIAEDKLNQIITESEGRILSSAVYCSLFIKPDQSIESIRSALLSPIDRVRQIAYKVLSKSNKLAQDEIEAGLNDTSFLVSSWLRHEISDQPTLNLALTEKLALLHNVDILAQLEPDELEELALKVNSMSFKAGDIICRENEQDDRVYIILKGEAKIVINKNNEKKLIDTVSAGECIGEIAVLGDILRTADVIAGDEGIDLLYINGKDFKNVIKLNPGMSLDIIKVISQRLLKQKG